MHIDQLIRTRRRTIALIVERDGRLVVRAPLHVTDGQIHKFAESKADWIKAKQAQAKKNSAVARKRYVAGEEFLYLGKAYPLVFVNRQKPALIHDSRFVLAITALPRARQLFVGWYKEQALRVISERVDLYAAKYGYTCRQVKFTSARTRWGSCSPNGNLSFTWRLVMAPLAVIDYVVVHELVHLKVKNHSKNFWTQVGEIMPDYKQYIAWLKANGPFLTLDGGDR
ncbi:MAG: SprT family zinc-dependent metalloprotease [Anaerolineales bacterium]|nr:SprT family zinc-dependent metalloprotease [Anaerolineales bacterium]